MGAPLRLENPVARARAIDARPSWWKMHVEVSTRAHRERRADRLELGGRERHGEARWVLEQVRAGMRDETGLGYLSPDRALPGGSPEVLAVVRRWDSEMCARSAMRLRLFRGEGEDATEWALRVLAEAERRIESLWHEQRAKGQRERFQRVSECATRCRGVIACRDCSEKSLPVPDLCGVALLCQRCRLQRINKYRWRIAESRERALERVRRDYLGPGQVKHDPLVERFLTLTVPHVPLELGGPERQAKLVRVAWRAFMNSLRNHWRKSAKRNRPNRWRTVLEDCAFVRCLEFTDGRDELGHVHVHCWMLSPFVRAQVYRVLWGRALVRAKDPETKEPLFPAELWPEHAWKEKAELLAELDGVDPIAWTYAKKTLPQRTPYPRIDVRRCYQDRLSDTGEKIVCELVKYLCKDFETAEADGRPIPLDPELFSAVYRGLDSGRMLTASRGFWVRVLVLCPCCGGWGSLRLVKLEPHELPNWARGPPLTRARGRACTSGLAQGSLFGEAPRHG